MLFIVCSLSYRTSFVVTTKSSPKFSQNSVNEIKVYNKVKAAESETQTKKVKKELQSDTAQKVAYNKKSNDDAIQNFTEKLSKLIDSQEKRLSVKLAPIVVKVKQPPKIDIKGEVAAIVTKEYINKLVTKDKPQAIDFNKEIKSVVTGKYINSLVVKQEIPVVDVKGQIKSIVNKNYVNDLVIKQVMPIIDVKTIITKDYINNMVTKEKPQLIDIKSEIESVVNKQYINAIYRNK